MHVHHQDREMCIIDNRSVSLELGVRIVFFVVGLDTGDQEGVAEDHRQAFQAESFHEGGQLQPHHAHQVFMVLVPCGIVAIGTCL